MKTLLSLLLGISLGFSIASFFGKTEKRVIRVDGVTLKKPELEHVSRAIELLKDRPSGRDYTRYVADSGTVALECPTDDTCNLEVRARSYAKAQAASPLLKNQTPRPSSKLQHGDIITSINGESMKTPSEALSHLKELLDHKNDPIQVTVIRDGKPLKLSFEMN